MMLMFLSASFVHAHEAPPTFTGTATIGTITASPGQNISVPLNVTNFSGIGSITFHIRYSPGLMNFAGISGGTSAGLGFVSDINPTDSTIGITFAPSVLSTTFANGLLLNLNFFYLGINSSELKFLNTCEVTQGLTTVYPTYFDGAININTGNSSTVAIAGTTASVGSYFTVPIQYAGFSGNVGAVTQKIKYDASKLNFVNITPTGTLTGAIGSASNGILTIVWSNTDGANINYANNPNNKIDVRFQYIGNTSTTLEFTSGSLIADHAEANVLVSYTNGTITPGSTSATASLNSVSFTGISQGQDIEVPITFGGLPTSDPVVAVTLEIPFDNSKLEFIGATYNSTYSATVNNAGTKINISWANQNSPLPLSGLLLKLKFKYLGIGNAIIGFGSACSFTTLADAYVQVAYTNTIVTSVIPSANATIGYNCANQGSEVLIPINFTGLQSNMGAATLVINYDVSKLTYLGVQDNTFSATVGSTAPNIITVAWNAIASTDINEGGGHIPFIKLRFLKNSQNTDCLATVNFTSGCELSDFDANIVQANWINGGVKSSLTSFTVTGGGHYCAGGSGVAVGLDGSQSCTGYTYQLKRTVSGNTTDVGSPLQGTGAAISFGSQTVAGTYTVVASNSGCTLTMTGSVEVVIDPLVGAAGAITGNVNVNAGTSGVSYSVGAISNATSYIWTYTGTGVTVNPSSNNVTLDFSSSATNGQLKVKGHNNCGDGTETSIAITVFRTLNLTHVFLEGLYIGSGTMSEALNNEFIPQWGLGIADSITIELHDAVDYYAPVIFRSKNVKLSTVGTATVILPGTCNGSYYITIKHRSSIETTTATTFSFANEPITCDFAAHAADVFGENVKDLSDGNFAIYCGDITSSGNLYKYPNAPLQDDQIDFGDINYIYAEYTDNENPQYGYVVGDINGNGELEMEDMQLVYHNAITGIYPILPSN